MSAGRRFRAVPSAAPAAAGISVGVTLQPVERDLTRRQGAAEPVDPCTTPATMRWRFFPGLQTVDTAVAADEEVENGWIYDLHNTEEGEFSPALGMPSAEVTAIDDGGWYPELTDAWEDDAISYPLNEVTFQAAVHGSFIVDFLDAAGQKIDVWAKRALGCIDADGNPALIQWDVRYVQAEASPDPETRSLPTVAVEHDWSLLVRIPALEPIIPGVLTITATDAASNSVFGPLEITFAVVEA